MSTLTAHLSPPLLNLDLVLDLDNAWFFEFCQRNRPLRIERTAAGEIHVMSPAGSKTSSRNSKITRQLDAWSERDGTGEAFDSSGGFELSNGAVRSPDAAWIELSRLKELALGDDAERFLPVCPTFVVELRSPTDTLASAQAKMREYLDNGARLGWLVDPHKRQVHVFRPGVDAEVLDKPRSVSGDPELPGFVLTLGRIWNLGW